MKDINLTVMAISGGHVHDAIAGVGIAGCFEEGQGGGAKGLTELFEFEVEVLGFARSGEEDEVVDLVWLEGGEGWGGHFCCCC